MSSLDIIRHYGVKTQLKKFNEEAYECIEAIIDLFIASERDYLGVDECKLKDHAIEEIADVLVVLDGFIDYFDIKREDIEYVKKYKVDRQANRIANGE